MMIFKKKILILSSGEGSNLQHIIDSLYITKFVNIVCIISDKNSFSIKRALQSDINCIYLSKKTFNKKQYNILLNNLLILHNPDLIILSGYMKVLSSLIINNFLHRIINIHPSLLPKYKGLNTHSRVFYSREKIHGTTIHFVNGSLDDGDIIYQKAIKTINLSSEQILCQKIKFIENSVFSKIIQRLLFYSFF